MGELMAVVDLLEQTEAAGLAGEPLKVLCDSQYVINTVTKWIPGWKRKGWRKADGKPVQNLELVQRLDELVAGRNVVFEWVKGHAGHELNEAADLRARAVATAYQRKSAAIPTGPGWAGAAMSGADASAEASPARAVAPADPQPALFDAAPLRDEPATDEETAVRLETSLLTAEVRADASRLAELLHPDFEEIGASGRLWDRDTTIQALTSSPAADAELSAVLGVSRVASDALLVVFETSGSRGLARRSSLWVRTASGWKLRFHQGTPAL
jgi:ribonuclease HI